ncbi:hypothetical protein NHX12_033599 [Muraenolepis orangiensis]|uniref:Uncharacterized protein n=1 Tax=Muraenolepis orangiensis TaxID=630683 RepID=A0A9Q0E5V2_9TELE|nr:hypothetical protein NHX12_033599 [Muraenolepis orangiensis]
MDGPRGLGVIATAFAVYVTFVCGGPGRPDPHISTPRPGRLGSSDPHRGTGETTMRTQSSLSFPSSCPRLLSSRSLRFLPRAHPSDLAQVVLGEKGRLRICLPVGSQEVNIR